VRGEPFREVDEPAFLADAHERPGDPSHRAPPP
jgi:hypothetical protein